MISASMAGDGEGRGVGTWRRALPLIGWLSALLAGIVLFHAMGRGALAPPPLSDPGAWATWASSREPAVVAAAVLRLVVLGLAWYLVGATTVGIVARLVRVAGLIRVADALTLPMVRRMLQGALGVGLATAMVGASTAPLPHQAPPTLTVAASAEAEGVGDGAVPRVTLTRAKADSGAADDAASPIAMRLLEQSDADADVGLRRQVDGSDGSAGSTVGLRAVEEEASDDAPGRDVHRVVAGESLWSISQDALARAWQREPTEVEVYDYWQRTMESNRQRLADPDNPDLIFPGDEVLLPAPLGEGDA